MKLNKKIICVILMIIVIFASFSTYAMDFSINKVNEQGTPIDFSEGTVTKKITNIENDEVKIELNIAINDKKIIDSDSEVLFLIDDSSSMNALLEDNVTKRKTKVLNSTEELISKINSNNPNVKMGIMSFSTSSQMIQNFTNDKNTLINACNEYAKKIASGNTSMETSLKTAKQKFSSNVKNKILILLTDGFPTDSESGTKAQLQDQNVYIISALVGLNDSNEEKIESIFGTDSNPTADRFYNIADNEIETVISNDIYNKILEDFKSTVTDIEIKDYFPEDIVNNFDIVIENKSKGNADINNNIIKWSINHLNNAENATMTYKLKLKSEYDTNIIDKILNTNEKVELNYMSMMGNNENKTMNDSPSIKIILNTPFEENTPNQEDKKPDNKPNVEIPESSSDAENIQKTNTTNTIKATTDQSVSNEDETISKATIPYAGNNKIALFGMIIGVIHLIITKKKISELDK